MGATEIHPWNVTPEEAVRLQKALRSQIRIEPFTEKIQYVAGADISFNLHSTTFYAGFVVLRWPDLAIVETESAVMDATTGTRLRVPGSLCRGAALAIQRTSPKGRPTYLKRPLARRATFIPL